MLSTVYEFPNTKPATSREDLVSDGPSLLDTEPSLPAHPSGNLFSNTLCGLASDHDEPALTSEGLEEHKRTFHFLTQPPQTVPNYGATLTTRAPPLSSENEGNLLRPANAPAWRRSMMSETSDTTLVDEPQPSTVYPEEEGKRRAGAEEDGADTEAVLRVLGLCGVLAVTQAILGLLAYCGVYVAPRRNRRAIAAKKVCLDGGAHAEGMDYGAGGAQKNENARG